MTLSFQGAIIRKQGQVFAIVIVKKNVIDTKSVANKAIRSFQSAFPGTPVVLMAQDSHGKPTYYGRPDIARFFANVPLQAIPWKEFTLNLG